MWRPGQLITTTGYVYIVLGPNFFKVAFKTTMTCRVVQTPTCNMGYNRKTFPLLRSDNYLSLERAYVKYWTWFPEARYVLFKVNIDHPLVHLVAGDLVNGSNIGCLNPHVEQFSPYYALLLSNDIFIKCGSQDS